MRRKQRFGEPVTETPDRRNSHRFPLRLPVKYRAIGHSAPSEWMVSESINISSGGLLFKTSEAVPSGQSLEAWVSWPVFLDKHIPLRLAAKGLVVRTGSEGAAMRFETYEFRTCQITSDAQVGVGARTEAGFSADTSMKIAG